MGSGVKRRRFPDQLPARYSSLRARGISDWAIRRDYERIAKGVWVSKDANDEGKWDVITRGRAQHLARPKLPLTGFAALAFYGLKFWADDAEVVVASHIIGPRRQRNGSTVRVESARSLRIEQPDPLMPELRCMNPEEALVSALRLVRRGEIAWWVPQIEGWIETEIRGVQLVDAMTRLLGSRLDLVTVLKLSKQRIGSRWMKKIIDATSAGADSPMETLLRLLVNGVQCESKRVYWHAQVPIFRDGWMLETSDEKGQVSEDRRGVQVSQPVANAGFVGDEPWMTVGDLVCKELKVVLFYDGEHHRSKEQHFRDTEIDAVLQTHGWRVMRVTAPMIRRGRELRERVECLVRDAVKAKA